MKLYFSPGACSLAPHIVLREAGLTPTLVKVDLTSHRTADGADFYAIAAKGQVPLLELDDGTRLSEGPVIAQYIADQAGATALMPAAGTPARYRVMEWQNFVTSELHKGFAPLFDAEVNAEAKQRLASVLMKKLRWVDGQLAEQLAGPFLTGTAFTAADAYLFVVTGWAPHVGLDLSSLANLQRWRSAVAERPAVREAMQAEGLAVR
jgi:glutathione S-transferase